MPRGAYAPPLLVVLRCGHLPVKLRLVRYTNARLQERRPSARRGSATAPAMAIRFRRVITFGTHDRMVHHGWLTRIAPGAALGGRMRIVANVRRRFARAIPFTTTAGLRKPLLLPLLMDACESLRLRGSLFARANRFTATAGLRQPLPPGAARGAPWMNMREWLRMCGSVSAGQCVFCLAGFSRVLCVSGSMCIMVVKRPQRTHTGLPNVRQLTRLSKS
jgi:hypothetical protein